MRLLARIVTPPHERRRPRITPYEIMLILNPEVEAERQDEIVERVFTAAKASNRTLTHEQVQRIVDEAREHVQG